MGGNSPSHSHEDDSAEIGITFVKGIKLSDRVINRMRESPMVGKPSIITWLPSSEPVAPCAEHLLPLLVTPPHIQTPPPQQPATAPSAIHHAPPYLTGPVQLDSPPRVTFHSPPPVTMAPNTFSQPVQPPTTDHVVSATPQPPTTRPEVSPVAFSASSDPVSPPESAFPPAGSAAEPPLLPSLPDVQPPVEALDQVHVDPEVISAPPVVEKCIEPVDPTVEPIALFEFPSDVLESPVASSQALVPPVPVKHMGQSSSLPTSLVGLLVETPPPVETTSSGCTPADPGFIPTLVGTVPGPTPTDPDAYSLHVPPPAETTPFSQTPPPPPKPPAPAPSGPPAPGALPPCRSVALTFLPAESSVSQPLLMPIEHPSPTPPPPVKEPGSAPESSPRVVIDVSSPRPPEVDVEELRRKIKEMPQRRLEQEITQEISQKKRQLLQQLEEALALGTAVYTETLRDCMVAKRMKTEDERLMAQLYWMELKAQKLDVKKRKWQNQDILFREHIKKLQATSAQFHRVSMENFQKGKEDAHKRFTRPSIKPAACGDLQRQTLRCYRENTGRTLYCSAIASAYMQCVDDAKKNKLSNRG